MKSSNYISFLDDLYFIPLADVVVFLNMLNVILKVINLSIFLAGYNGRTGKCNDVVKVENHTREAFTMNNSKQT